jgi:PAS domain S-box-containing protein
MYFVSYLSAVAVAVYLYCGYRVFMLAPGSPANRVGAVLNALLALWALASVFCYYPLGYNEAAFWYRSFAFTWCFFPSILLHFSLLSAGTEFPAKAPRRLLAYIGLYSPAAFFTAATNTVMVVDFEFRGGYWFPVFSHRGWFLAFSVYFILFGVLSLAALIRGRLRATGRTERKRLNLIIVSIAAALSGGFVTDVVFMLAKVSFPNMVILWVLIWAIGIFAAMSRYSFLSPFPASEAGRIVDAMADAFFYLDESGSIVWANESALRLSGAANLEQLKGRRLESLLECAEGLLQKFDAVFGAKQNSASGLCSFSGSGTPAAVRLIALRDRKGPAGFIAAGRDLTEERRRERAENLLEETGLLLGSFIERSLDGIVVTDQEGRVVRWNPAVRTITGIDGAEARGRCIWDVLESVSRDDEYSANRVRYLGQSIKAAFREGADDWAPRNKGIPIRDRRGRDLILQASGFFLPSSDGPVFSAIVRDVTDERRAAEETVERIKRLDHAQKMDAIGTLTGGLAHDFNNALGGIVGAVSLIRLGLADGSYSRCEDLIPEIDIIERSADRASKTVRRLLSLAKKRPHEFASVRLDEILQHVVDVASRSLDPAVTLFYERPEAEAVVLGDAAQLEQLALNLVINAAHSMTIMRGPGDRRGGMISVTLARRAPVPDLLAVNPSAEDKPYWVVGVSDQGVGISAEIRAKIFDPFFTTKPPDVGSGLGLAMVHSIAKQHGGFVELESSLGEGSSFWVYLPASEASVRGEFSPRSRIEKGSGVILVAEDEENLRRAVTAMLAALGYQTVAAEDGRAAVAAFAAEPDRFSGALLDMSMPEMSGPDALAEIRRLRPGFPAVLASGFPTGIPSGIVFLAKPFSIEELGRAVGDAIRRGGIDEAGRR